jgi:hypothetical protein
MIWYSDDIREQFVAAFWPKNASFIWGYRGAVAAGGGAHLEWTLESDIPRGINDLLDWVSTRPRPRRWFHDTQIRAIECRNDRFEVAEARFGGSAFPTHHWRLRAARRTAWDTRDVALATKRQKGVAALWVPQAGNPNMVGP